MVDPDFLGVGFVITPDSFAALFEVGTQRVLRWLHSLWVVHGY